MEKPQSNRAILGGDPLVKNKTPWWQKLRNAVVNKPTVVSDKIKVNKNA